MVLKVTVMPAYVWLSALGQYWLHLTYGQMDAALIANTVFIHILYRMCKIYSDQHAT